MLIYNKKGSVVLIVGGRFITRYIDIISVSLSMYITVYILNIIYTTRMYIYDPLNITYNLFSQFVIQFLYSNISYIVVACLFLYFCEGKKKNLSQTDSLLKCINQVGKKKIQSILIETHLKTFLTSLSRAFVSC